MILLNQYHINIKANIFQKEFILEELSRNRVDNFVSTSTNILLSDKQLEDMLYLEEELDLLN